METTQKYLEREFGKQTVLDWIDAHDQIKATREFKREGTNGLSDSGLRKALQSWTGNPDYGIPRRYEEPVARNDKRVIEEFMAELVPFVAAVSKILSYHNSTSETLLAEKDRAIRGLFAEVNYYRRRRTKAREFLELPS